MANIPMDKDSREVLPSGGPHAAAGRCLEVLVLALRVAKVIPEDTRLKGRDHLLEDPLFHLVCALDRYGATLPADFVALCSLLNVNVRVFEAKVNVN
jgi:hypothetical protein